MYVPDIHIKEDTSSSAKTTKGQRQKAAFKLSFIQAKVSHSPGSGFILVYIFGILKKTFDFMKLYIGTLEKSWYFFLNPNFSFY